MARMPDGWVVTVESDGLEVRLKESRELVMCRNCKYSDVIYDTTLDTMPLKCLNIRYGGVMPDWYCEHGERRDDDGQTD